MSRAIRAHLGDFIHPEVETDYGAYLHDLYVGDGLAYLNYWGLGLIVVDANDPQNITEVGRFADYPRRSSHSNWVTTTTGGRKISIHGDEDFTAHLEHFLVAREEEVIVGAVGAGVGAGVGAAAGVSEPVAGVV